MKVVNNGHSIVITCDFSEAAALIGAVEKGAFAYESQRQPEFAEEAWEMTYKLRNAEVKID